MSVDIDQRLPDMRKREALIVHIEGLQAVLAKRNETIARLQAQTASDGDSPLMKSAVKKAFRRGWQECAQRLIAATSQAGVALTTINQAASAAYHEIERRDGDE